MKTLSNNYGGRLYRLFGVNVPTLATLGWKAAKMVLDEATVEKIALDSDIDVPGLWKLCDKSQVEQKYGGTQPNRTSYWYDLIQFRPVSLPNPVVPPESLLSDEQYLKMFKDGKLKNNIVDPWVSGK